MPPTSRSNRIPSWISGALLVTGSVLFLAGGRLHPKAGTAFGTVGTAEFFRTFADHIQHAPNWIPIHVLILIGPVLWALGMPPAREIGSPDGIAPGSVAGSALDTLASRAMLLGAALWAVVFVLDGFVAPQAATIIASATPTDVDGLLAAFRLNQVAVIRLGLVSWILIGVAMAMQGGTLLAGARGRSPARALVGIAGISIGLWPIIATITGEFDPGPFTSRLWNVSALSTASWFAAFGIASMAPARVRSAPGAIESPVQPVRDLVPQG